MFPTGSTVQRSDDYGRTALIVNINTASGLQMVGAFFANATKDTRSQHIPFIILPKNADVTPYQRSITVSIGDHVTLRVHTAIRITELKWKVNNISLLQGNGEDTLTINNVRTSDAGIYECYKERNGKHAMMRLIVRGCPATKYGMNCDVDCPVCYNGGICDHVTGLCICPAGFKGVDCSEGCGNNDWGRTCGIVCSKRSGATCSGILLCPPDPVGCSCIAGFHGDTCDQACTGNNYGAGCSQECHCTSTDCDNERGCQIGTTCSNGFYGDKCLDHITCADGKFGRFCQYNCHCATSASCDKDTGYCDSGDCEHGWGGNDCQIGPLISPHIAVTATSSSSLTITWQKLDSNSKKIQCNTFDYEIYCESDSESRTIAASDVTSTTIDRLLPCTLYTCKVRIENNAGFKGPWSNIETVETHANAPNKIDGIDVTTGTNNISLTWNKVENGDCPVMYNVTYQLIQADMCEDVHVDAVEEGPFDTSSYIISNLSAYSKYAIHVTSVSNSAEQLSDIHTVQTEEGVPTGFPTSLQVVSAKSKSISLSWEPPKCGNRKGLITYDYKLFLDKLELKEYKIGYADTQTTIDGIDTTKMYTFEIEARTSKGIGPKSIIIVTSFKHTSWWVVGLLITCIIVVVTVIVVQTVHYKRKSNLNTTSTVRSKMSREVDKIEMQDGYVVANQLNTVVVDSSVTDYNRPVKLKDLHMYIKHRKQGTSFTFTSEFGELFSRYSSIRLEGKSDKSNACYINDKPNAYIAYHGNEQEKQLLEMIWRENINIIVNITCDGDKVNCNLLLHENTGCIITQHGKMHVRKLEAELNDNGFTVCKFEIMTENRESRPRVVHQYNFIAWPGDVMDTSAHLIEFTHSLRKAKKDSGVGPILVYRYYKIICFALFLCMNTLNYIRWNKAM
ncbi:uncharacterized protein [Antedon mediterranea]|uniref:uncharacterized protein n=1 Tax=Antedon mediterranea TaxID=105859 RepID=UPI003AF45C9B